MKNLKTIDINAKEWFDKINGNSYFAGTVIVNYNLKDEKTFLMPLQYGYSYQYEYEAKKLLTEFNIISTEYSQNLFNYCDDNGIEINSNKQTRCLKRELKQIEKDYNNKQTKK
jgi:hypothetical protein